jgi:membrane-associated phospholipid phosphatase
MKSGLLILIIALGFNVITKKLHSQEWIVAGTIAGIGIVSWHYDEEIQAYFAINNNSSASAVGQYFLEPVSGGYAALPILAVTWFYGNHKEKNNLTDFAIQGAKAFVLARAITYIPKYLLHRERPYEQETPDKNVWHGFSFNTSNTSFPSGHSASAFALATVAAKEFKDYKWVAPVAYSLATVSSFSRVYRNQHWMSDIAAGCAIGLLTGYAINKIPNSFFISPSYSKDEANLTLIMFF